MAKAFVVGTFDTKATELDYMAGLLKAAGIETVTVDLGTRGSGGADVTAAEVAAHHPDGADAALGVDDRGRAVDAMALAFCHFVATRHDIGGIIGNVLRGE